MPLSRILILLSGLLLAAGARAELPASLERAAAQVASVPIQRQSLAANLEAALKSGVAEQDLQSVMRLAAAQKYSAANTAAFVQQLVAVRRDDLPIAPVRDKLLEGMAKKVPAESILSVTSQWQGALKDAASTVRAMEERGLKYDKAGERETLINLGAGLRQRYGAKDALTRLSESAEKGGRMAPGAGSLIAAGNLVELLLLHNATPAQALELPMTSLRVGHTPAQIQALQRTVLDQLRQGVAPVDVVSSLRGRFNPKVDTPPAAPAFSNPGQPPGGSWPGSAPGGGFPGGAPGGSFPGGGPSGGSGGRGGY